MKIIDLNKYDLSYDIQFLWFMIELIKPYIIFEKPLMEKEDDCTYPMINIYRRVPNPEIQLHTSDRGDDNTKLPPPTTSDKSIVGLTNREGLQIISFEELIIKHFDECMLSTFLFRVKKVFISDIIDYIFYIIY